MPERILIALNNHATNAKKVSSEVLAPLDDSGIPYDTFTTPSSNYDDNVEAFGDALRDGDRLVIPAGDGTASQAVNAIIRSATKGVELAPLPYGGFVDLAPKKARILDAVNETADTVTRYPLAVHLNGDQEPWRYAAAYAGIGRLALIAHSFSGYESREKMRGRNGFAKLGGQVIQLANQYFEQDFHLPDFYDSTSPMVKRAVTDVMMINNDRAGGIMKFPKNFGESDTFGVVERDISRIVPNIPFGLMALAGRAPTDEQTEFSMQFAKPIELPIHTEGEFAWQIVNSLRVQKSPDASYITIR